MMTSFDWRAELAADATRHGPATCGCVPMRLYFENHFYGGKERPHAWTLCPICKGSGIDPRIK